MNINYLGTQEAKDVYLMGIDFDNISNTSVSGIITAASRMVDNFTSANDGWEYEQIVNESYDTLTGCHIDTDGNFCIALRKRPLQSVDDVTAISLNWGPSTIDLTLTSGGKSLLFSPAPGWTVIYPGTFLVTTGTLHTGYRLMSAKSLRLNGVITYSAGYKAIPEDIKQATAFYARFLLSQRFNQLGAIESSQGSMRAKYASNRDEKSPFQVAAEQILLSYRRVV